jgi:hypothetical protein
MGLLIALALQTALGPPSIRLFEQADGPVLPPTRRVYSTRFDAWRTRMLGVEIRAGREASDAASSIPVDCTLTRPDGSDAPAERAVTLDFDAGQTHSQGAALLWRRPASQEWPPGSYIVECRAPDRPPAKATLQIAENPPDVTAGEIRVAAMRIFPVDTVLPPQPQREYAATLAAEQTKRIGVEIEFSHAPLGRTARIPVDCWFFWPDGQTSPPLELSYEPQPDWAGGFSAGAMGFEQPGSWPKGVYTVTCAMHGRPVAVERFDVN